jgi:glucose/arabinose dehydrogenase
VSVGRVHRGSPLIVVLALLLSSLPSAALPSPTHAATLPNGFTESVVFSGLVNPTIVRFSPDGRVFVGEKSGLIKVFDSLTDPTPTVFADLRTETHNFWDRGLLGMALAPGFPADPSVYVLYTYDALPGGTAPQWGTPGATGDGCPSPPGATTDGCVVTGRLSRLTATGDTATAETTLITDWCQQYPSHSIGSLIFGADGYLYVSAGEGANFNIADYGQGGGSSGSPTPKNPCGDPPAGVGGTEAPPSAEGGALRSQDVRTAGDPTGLDGSILRIDPATGAAAPGNPLAASPDLNARRIVATGFRNPFRMTLRPGSNELWVGDVGWSTWEEIDRVTPPGASVANYGWPCYEGAARQSGYDALNLSICENLYAAGPTAVVSPYYTYNHSSTVVPGETCATGSSAIAGLAFYQGGGYPSQYAGALFFADNSRDCIWVMFAGANGLPDPAQRATLVAGAANPVDLEIGPGGDLYYVDFDGGTIRRISGSGGSTNQPPTAAISAVPSSGNAPLTVTFSAAGSSDPDGDPLSYAWDLNADGQFDDATGLTTSFTYTTAGNRNVGVRVSDGHGGSASAFTLVSVSATGGTPTVTYLSDLNPTSATNGYGPYERDTSVGGQAAGDGLPLTLNGVVYAKGLGAHAISDLRYQIPTGSCTFNAAIGLDDEIGDNGTVIFTVYVDGVSSYTSGVMTGASATQLINLALPSGASQLQLVAGDAGDNNWFDHADWADARFTCS